MANDRKDCRRPPCRHCSREGCKGSATDRRSPHRFRLQTLLQTGELLHDLLDASLPLTPD